MLFLLLTTMSSLRVLRLTEFSSRHSRNWTLSYKMWRGTQAGWGTADAWYGYLVASVNNLQEEDVDKFLRTRQLCRFTILFTDLNFQVKYRLNKPICNQEFKRLKHCCKRSCLQRVNVWKLATVAWSFSRLPSRASGCRFSPGSDCWFLSAWRVDLHSSCWQCRFAYHNHRLNKKVLTVITSLVCLWRSPLSWWLP